MEFGISGGGLEGESLAVGVEGGPDGGEGVLEVSGAGAEGEEVGGGGGGGEGPEGAAEGGCLVRV